MHDLVIREGTITGAGGAGHDAMILAAPVPVAMLFLRSPGGLSHHPDDSVNVADIEAALAAGAGHDAMILAAPVPVAMLFLPSPVGLSHHPDESVNAADIEAALAAGAALLAKLEQTHA